MDSRQARRLTFLSSCPDAWGGSEELWSGAARRLAADGHRVSVVKTLVDSQHPRIRALHDAGIATNDYWDLPLPFAARARRRLLPPRWQGSGPTPEVAWLIRHLRRERTELAVVCQGSNYDGAGYGNACHAAGIPYIMIAQKAADDYWPIDALRPGLRHAYESALHTFFVAEHNRRLTELQIGVRLDRASVVRNPVQNPTGAPLPWPTSGDGRVRLACVARLFVLEKGQDLLLRVLDSPRWRSRPLDVTFFGQGFHAAAIRDAAALLGLENVRFAGFVPDIAAIWREHHALVLPSRSEGLPLALVEAMIYGRVGIVTDVGDNASVIDDGVTGFLAAGPGVGEIDDALERAWNCRDNWPAIGEAASTRARAFLPADPCHEFATRLLSLCP